MRTGYSIWAYALKRLLGIVPLVVLISMLCFALMHAVPGGPTGMLAENPKISSQDKARIRSNFGLDRPIHVQYAMWFDRAVFHGDFGFSYATGEPVARMIIRRLPATLELMGSALALAFLVALLIAIVSARKKGSPVDTLLTVVSLALISIPVFWSGLMAMMFFSVKWGLLPTSGMMTVGSAFSVVDHLKHLILPSTVLSLVFIASWSRYLRVSLCDVLTQDFITVARAKGMTARSVLLRHALRNAAAPFLTVIALNLPLLFTGTIIVEQLFSWPGMGRLFYDGLLQMDYTRLMAIVFVSSILITVSNLMVDLVYGLLDPRIRYAQ